jgi:Zn-dependent protease with chaperone function
VHRIFAAFIATTLTILTAGCVTAPVSPPMWIADHGGVLPPDARQARVDAVSRPLIAACTGRTITVQVLANDAVTAYSLWDGHVFVTRGLVDHLDDAELQAAVAHELGHLVSDRHVQSVASLRGCCVDPDREVRADAVGAELLRNQGFSPGSMVNMLRKVEKFGSLPPQCVVAVERRIAMLSADPSNH